MRMKAIWCSWAIVVTLVLAASMAFAQGPAAQGGAPAAGAAAPTDYAHMTIKTDKLADNFYTLIGLNGAGRDRWHHRFSDGS